MASVTLPFHIGRTEGVNTRKMIKRQMFGRQDSPSCATGSCSANATHVTTESKTEPLEGQTRGDAAPTRRRHERPGR